MNFVGNGTTVFKANKKTKKILKRSPCFFTVFIFLIQQNTKQHSFSQILSYFKRMKSSLTNFCSEERLKGISGHMSV